MGEDDYRMLIRIVGDGLRGEDYDDGDDGDGDGDDATVVVVAIVVAGVGYRGIVGSLLNLNEWGVVMVVVGVVALVETVALGNIDLEIPLACIVVVSRKNCFRLHRLFVAKLAS